MIFEEMVEKMIFASLGASAETKAAGTDAMAKRIPMAKEARLKDQLLRQLGFLEHSAIAYDQGHKDEAIRMAAVMRTLFCNSKKSGDQECLNTYLSPFLISRLLIHPAID